MNKSKFPDEYYLVSKIASLIDSYVMEFGIKSFLNGKIAIGMNEEYNIFLSDDIECVKEYDNVIAYVYFSHLKSWDEFKRINTKQDDIDFGLLSCIKTEDLALEILFVFKEQIGINDND